MTDAESTGQVVQIEDENPESLAGEPVEFDPDDIDDDDDDDSEPTSGA